MLLVLVLALGLAIVFQSQRLERRGAALGSQVRALQRENRRLEERVRELERRREQGEIILRGETGRRKVDLQKAQEVVSNEHAPG
ncbi:hypothetical protein [Tautonia plasticadhaerens]|nr:hypothetical protein [Tautonia plasticadhaerens]